jgi:PncC family amidohydrolase
MAEFADKVVKLQKIFEGRGLTLSLAESCTGGLLSATIAALPGVSKFFKGAVVSYAREVKNEILDVPLSLLQVMGEVSTPVALEMARGAKANLRSTWALSITGVAGPGGGSVEKPVGMVCFALVGPGYSETFVKYFEAKSREHVQRAAVDTALNILIENVGR